jgi:hypothetical protein
VSKIFHSTSSINSAMNLHVYSVASRISKLWGIVPHSIEKCGGFEKDVGDIH